MALSVKYQLSKSKGLSKILYCHGLEFTVVIHPTIHGDPILTSQAFYYLDHLECVAEFRFEDPSKKPTNNQVEYLLPSFRTNPKLYNELILHASPLCSGMN